MTGNFDLSIRYLYVDIFNIMLQQIFDNLKSYLTYLSKFQASRIIIDSYHLVTFVILFFIHLQGHYSDGFLFLLYTDYLLLSTNQK